MVNEIKVIGRIVKSPELIEDEKGNQVSNITLAVSRGYKNENGEYETDFIPCVLWKSIADNICNYVKQGDLIMVSGHLQVKDINTKDDSIIKVPEIIAEKVTFLSSERKQSNEELER